MEKINIVALDGSNRETSMTRNLLLKTAAAFDSSKTDVTVLEQHKLQLPVYSDIPSLQENAGVQHLISSMSKADAIILSSPEYHGSMSGALKNALDWCTLLDGEFAGKVVGLIGGGGAMANSGATLQMMMSVRAMHGWLMPDVMLSVSNIWNAFDKTDNSTNPALEKRMKSFVEKLTNYGYLFRSNREFFKDAA